MLHINLEWKRNNDKQYLMFTLHIWEFRFVLHVCIFKFLFIFAKYMSTLCVYRVRLLVKDVMLDSTDKSIHHEMWNGKLMLLFWWRNQNVYMMKFLQALRDTTILNLNIWYGTLHGFYKVCLRLRFYIRNVVEKFVVEFVLKCSA